jgi:hypothetical protein
MHGSGARGQFFLIDLNGGFAPIVLFAFDLNAAFIAVGWVIGFRAQWSFSFRLIFKRSC